MQDAFFHRDGDRLVPTVATRGPWDLRFQHGGPPTALLTAALMAQAGERFRLARITADFLRPVPITPLRVEVERPQVGRTVQRATATLHADRPVLRVQALFIRDQTGDASDPAALAHTPEPWPAPDACTPFVFPFFAWDEGYHRGVDMRLAGGTWGRTPARFWARPTLPLIAGETTAPEARVVLIADAESGMGPPLDPDTHTFANPDLTVLFSRRPASGWLGFDLRAAAGGAGAGVASAGIRDDHGPFGVSAQTLLVSPRR